MPISRLRLRFAAAFALVFGVMLGLFVTVGVWHQWRESNRRLDERLLARAVAVDHALVQRMREDPAHALPRAAADVELNWPREADGFIILDAQGRPIATRDPRGLGSRALAAARATRDVRFDLLRDGDDARAMRRAVAMRGAMAPAGPAEVLVFDSTEDIERDIEALSTVLLIGVPLLVLMSLAGGYLLAGRALRPMHALGEAIDALPPEALGARLALPVRRDEVTALAERVNTLLERVQVVRLRHQRFVREAAHQIRTPLTLVLGETEHALAAAPAGTTGERADARVLGRVLVAAEQMRRRVDELLLYAEADSGTTFARTDVVELDDLALECTDLMRRRAAALGRQLALVELAPVTVRGNAALLREALLEMLENACRHGSAARPVTVGSEALDDEAHLVVRSAIAPISEPSAKGTGLGVPILQWIAAGHGGRFESSTEGTAFVARLVLSSAP